MTESNDKVNTGLNDTPQCIVSYSHVEAELNVEAIKYGIQEMIIYDYSDFKESLKMIIDKDGSGDLASQNEYSASGKHFSDCQAILVEDGKIIYNPENVENFMDYGEGISLNPDNFESIEDFEKVLTDAIYQNMLTDYINYINN